MNSFSVSTSVLFINSSFERFELSNKNSNPDLYECEENDKGYHIAIDLQKYLGVGIVCFLASVGVLLNLLCIFALCSKRAPKNIFNMLLLNLLLWDATFLILHFTRSITYEDFDECDCKKSNSLIPLWNIALAESVFATLILSIERYICINHEGIYMKYISGLNSRRILLKFILPITIVVFIVHIP